MDPETTKTAREVVAKVQEGQFHLQWWHAPALSAALSMVSKKVRKFFFHNLPLASKALLLGSLASPEMEPLKIKVEGHGDKLRQLEETTQDNTALVLKEFKELKTVVTDRIDDYKKQTQDQVDGVRQTVELQFPSLVRLSADVGKIKGKLNITE